MRKAIIGVITALFFVSNAFGAGFNLYEHGARASSLAGAVVAQPYDISTIFYNPGGLSFIDGMNFYGGVTIIRPSNKFIGAAPIFDNTIHEVVQHTFASLGLYYSYQINEKLVAGLGITNPYGLALEWEDDFPGNAIAQYTDLKSFYISPVLSYKITPNLSVGGGLDLVYSTVQLERDVRITGSNLDVAKIKLEGDNGLAYGFSAGIMYQADKFGLGFMYRHTVENKYDDGDASFTFYDTPARTFAQLLLADQKVSTGITFPSNLVAGIRYQITDKLGAELDYAWFKWSVFDQLDLDFKDSDALDQVVLENYEDSYQIRLGIDYMLNEKIELRAGYVYDQTPQPIETVSPQLPDNDRNDYSFGIGYKKDNMKFDLGYMLVDFGTRSTLEDGIGQNHYGFNGEYSGIAHLFLLSYGMSF